MQELKVGMLGLGTVGSAVARILLSRQDLIAREIGMPARLVRVAVRDAERPRAVELPPGTLTTRVSDVLDDPVIDLVVEVIGGERPAFDLIRQAIVNRKSVVTANKEVMAKFGREILALAAEHNVDVHYEASVGGGIPLIGPFKQDLAANRITRLFAIINGTTNFILSRMAADGILFSEALAEAQRLGYAEPDPTNDIEGVDACYKLVILAALGFKVHARPESVFREGISHLQPKDFRYAREMGYVIKLLAIAKEVSNDSIELRVHPALIPERTFLAGVNGVLNAVEVEGDLVGTVVFSGRGAGPEPTGSAIVADIIDIGQNHRRQYGYWAPTISYDEGKRVLPMEAVNTRYYVRLEVADRAGVLAQVTRVLGDANISIASIIQKEANPEAQSAELVIMTHQANEAALVRAVAQLRQLEVVRSLGNFLRVESE